ncbi:MAG: hypothetical protein IPJ26_15725 [Bacteroidetes bacterium]|nr:hypothetical protein [Bacteroidota bacterium]
MNTKILAIAMVTISLTISIFYVIQVEYVKWVVLFSMLAIDGYILSVKTRKANPQILPLKTSKKSEKKSSNESDKKIFNSH